MFVFSFVFIHKLDSHRNYYCRSGDSTEDAREGLRESIKEKWAKFGPEEPGVLPSFTLNSKTLLIQHSLQHCPLRDSLTHVHTSARCSMSVGNTTTEPENRSILILRPESDTNPTGYQDWLSFSPKCFENRTFHSYCETFIALSLGDH